MPDSSRRRNPERFLRTADVCAKFGGVQPETIWRWRRAGWFPEPIRLSPTSRINVWPESQIDALATSGRRGPGHRPDAAIAERGRRIANRKQGRTGGKIGFMRGKKAPP